MPSELVILIPVLRRPHRIQPLLDSIASATPEPHDVLFLCTPSDKDEIAAIEAVGAPYLICGTWRPGDYARKINLGYRSTANPLLFLAADDLLFHPGWFPAAQRHLSTSHHVIGTNDLGNPRVLSGRHSTHTLVTREYVDKYGTIDKRGEVLHEGYDHCFTDDEFIHTAIARKMFHFARDSIVEHLHPNWKKAEWDDVYSIADQSLRNGRRLFNRRRILWLNRYGNSRRLVR